MPILVIGDKNISSWSLRAWLILKMLGVPFEERMIRLYRPESPAELREASPAGMVPVLLDGPLHIWDTLAIAEYLAERFPAAALWPADPAERALARSVTAEMHSGFADLRKALSMNVVLRRPGMFLDAETRADVARVVEIWSGLRAAHREAGPFLFGRFTIADAFYAPVVLRFRSYGVDVADAGARAYADTILNLGAIAEWTKAAEEEVRP